MHTPRIIRLAILAAAVLAPTLAAAQQGGASSTTPTPLASARPGPASGAVDTSVRGVARDRLEVRLEELDQRLRILARLRELERDSLLALERTRPQLTAGREGFVAQSADGEFQLRLRGYIQSDGRFFVDPRAAAPGAQPPVSSFLLRRARPIVEASVYRYFGFRLMPDFGQGRTTLFDAYVDARVGRGATSPLTVRAGKFKPPLGLERLQSALDLRFAERGLPTNLVPNRDVGIQLGGDPFGGTLSYGAGVFDGVVDLGNGDTDSGGSKDFHGRLFVQPFVRRGPAALRGLGLGIAASAGAEHGSAAAAAMPTYVTPGQVAFFRYLSGGADSNTTVADGRRARFAPQGYFYAGPFGVLGEYVSSAQAVRRADRSARLTHRAWQLAGSWFLTGERAGFGAVAPKHPVGGRGWGALELAARYGELAIDRAAFPAFASPASSSRRARAWAVGANWHLARGVKLVTDYELTHFAGGASAGDRAPERLLVTRLQTAF